MKPITSMLAYLCQPPCFQELTMEELQHIENNCYRLLEKFHYTGQTNGIQKLLFLVYALQQEKELLRMGFTHYVTFQDIAAYETMIYPPRLKQTPLRIYENEMPDWVTEKYAAVRSIGGEAIILSVDTNKIDDMTANERILFLTFEDESSKAKVERWYYVGSWVETNPFVPIEKWVETRENSLEDNAPIILLPRPEESTRSTNKWIQWLEKIKFIPPPKN